MMNASEYKKYHESFMQNNHGSTAFHTFCCILFTVQCAIYISIKPKYSPSFQYVYEYIVMVLSMIIAHTILAEYIYILNIIITFILLYELLFHVATATKKFKEKNFFENNRIPFVTCLRGLTYLITVFAILAVDFQDFPRYLAKTERYGYSLMDTGVALFVLASGLVHKDLKDGNYKEIIKGNLKVFIVLIILGTGRFISVKQINYHEHVTEYGVHWNFFFTIAVCKLVSTVILCFSNYALSLSITIILVHELSLYTSLQEWVFSDTPRDSLISANREGLTSCLGYVSLYLFAVHIKQFLLNKSFSRYVILKGLALESILLWLLAFIINIFLPASRTLVNMSYVLYMNAVLVTVVTILYFLVTVYSHPFQDSLILANINMNGLTYFLIANLMTGAVNLSIRTLFVSSTVTFFILNVYMIASIVFISCIKGYGFKI